MGCGGVRLIRSEIVVGVGATVRRTWVASESVPVLTDQRSTPQRAKRDGGTAVTTATTIAMGRNLLWNSRILASLDSVRNEELCYWPVALQAISKFCFSFRKTAREPPAIVALVEIVVAFRKVPAWTPRQQNGKLIEFCLEPKKSA